ncbi:arginine kinase [Euwallacea fornicatus]|uniref:arginine kinase n=1 Tax=Euwallacea fornicatus TaxID=995702 RepID=UPI00338F2D63
MYHRNIFDTVKLRVTKLDHNLYDLIWPNVKKLPSEPSLRLALEEDFPLGIMVPDLYAYKVFEEFLNPIIKEYNYIDVNHDFSLRKGVQFFQEGIDEIDLHLDPLGTLVVTGKLECSRNIKDFDLPKSLALSELEIVERIITNILLNAKTARALYPNASEDEIRENGSGDYYTMNEVLEQPSEAKVILASSGLLIPLWNIPESDRLHGSHWPYGRGVFVNNSHNLAIYVNVLDHIRIITCTDAQSSAGNVGLIYTRLSRVMQVIQENLDFVFDEKLGCLSSRPTFLGCGLHFSLTLKCPNLLKEPDKLRSLCTARGLTYNKHTNAAEVFKISNRVTVGVTELQCFEDFTTAVSNILQLEKDMTMSNSLHIAALFLSIFKKRKSASYEINKL